MKNKLLATCSVLALVAVAGCASSNIKSYRVDQGATYEFQNLNIKPVNFVGVTKPDNDSTSIDCRMGISINLPQKMTYSKYVDDAFKKTLHVLNKLNGDASSPKMSIVLTKVDFSSMSGKWYIEGDVTIDGHKSISVKTASEYGTAYVAESACQLTADAFDEAVKQFIKDVLTNAHVSSHLQ